MKKLIALLALTVMFSVAMYAANTTATNTFNQTVVCPATELLSTGDQTALLDITAGTTQAQTAALSWNFKFWGDDGKFKTTITKTISSNLLTAAETYSSTDLSNATPTETEQEYTFSNTPCNTTGSITVTVNSTTADATMASGPYTIKYELTVTAI